VGTPVSSQSWVLYAKWVRLFLHRVGYSAKALKHISGFAYKESEKSCKTAAFWCELDLPFAFCEAPA
jgi:hypothetical protein